MIDKKDIKKMWVWDGDFLNPKKTQRYILFKVYDYYIAVDKNSERSFENGGDFDVEPWENCEPIKEPSLNDLPEGWDVAWYRLKGGTMRRHVITIDDESGVIKFNIGQYIKGFNIEGLKKYWQIKINGEWHDCSEYLGGEKEH